MGANRIKTKDKGVEFDTFRKVTMTKKLVIRFVKFERALAMQILEQEGIFKTIEHVRVRAYPSLDENCVFLRSWEKEYDFSVRTIRFNGNAERDEYLDKVVKWISEEQFSGSGKLEVGKECEFSDDGVVWYSGHFGGKCAKELGEPRFLAAGSNILVRFKNARPIASCVQPKIDGDVYTWEMEVAE